MDSSVLAYGYQEVLAYAGTNSGVVTNGTTTYGPFRIGPFKGIRVEAERTADAGTATMACKLQYYDEASGDFSDFLDGAGNAVVLNDYADGETGHRFFVLKADAAGGADVDLVLAVGNNNYYSQNPPETFQLVVTHGGTSISNTYSLGIHFIP